MGKKTTRTRIFTCLILMVFIAVNSNKLSAQETIPSTGSEATTCGNCAPTGWLDNGGTPDISNRDSAGGQGSLGGGDTWVNAPLALPPTGDLTWITMRDIGDYNASPVESVRTTMGGLVSGNVYILNMYINTSISNGDGGDYYSGQYIDRFLYQIYKDGDTPVDQTIIVTSDAHDKWTKVSVIFIGDPNGSGEMNLALSPDDNAVTSGDDQNFESINIAVELNDLSKLDTDGDGVPDKDDIDDDNDGILDTVEATLSGTAYAPIGDEDGDGLPNYLDVFDNNLAGGDSSNTSYVDANSDGIPDVFDFDNDGIPNHLDLDSDNDGIPDNIEAQTTAGYIAPAADNAATYTTNNGLNSAYVGQAFISSPTNTDGTDEADYRDLNSDNDATSDTTEANLILNGTVGDNGLDNSYDNGDDYTDVNGVFDNTQTDNFPDTGPGSDVNWRDSGIDGTLDTDGDGVPNDVDIDDDNDGILDVDEQSVCAGTLSYEFYDANYAPSVDNIPTTGALATGVVSAFDVDALYLLHTPADEETFGIRYTGYINIETSETYTFYTNSDDGSKLFINGIQVVDNDGDHGPQERSGTIPLTPGAYPITVLFYENGGGESLSVEYSSPLITRTTLPFTPLFCTIDEQRDTDGDGIPNHLDLDSDGDGIPDNIEAQSTTGYTAPSGAVGAGFTDFDGDGLDDNYDPVVVGGTAGGAITLIDTDGDGTDDYLDTDSDDDGADDRVEANSSLTGFVGINGLDSSRDNGDNYTDVNGTFDTTQTDNFPDADGDVNSGGNVDYRDADSVFIDNDNDGVPDETDLDDDNDGILDSVETAVCVNGLTYQFFNSTPSGDTVANIPTTGADFTGTATDFDVNGLANTLTGDTETYSIRYNGTININTAETYTFYINSDDGSRLYIDGQQVVDYDGLHGASGHQSGSVALAIGVHSIEILFFENTGGDSLDVEYSSTSVTRQDLPFSVLSAVCDSDNDGIPDYKDLDSDNDGIPDNIEAQPTAGYDVPDGVYDANGVDTAYTGGITPQDTDIDLTPDYLDTDSDDDGVLDNTEAGVTLTGVYGNNGLDNAYDNGDSYVDVNGSFDNSQTDNFPDADGDVFNGGDVDYRDDTFTVDTDGDSVNDEVDLDDDNDGILDSVEMGTCTPGASTLDWDSQFSINDDPTDSPANAFTIDHVGFTITRTSNVSSGSTYQINSNTATGAYNLLQLATQNAVSRQILNFDTPIYGMSFTLADIDQDTGTATDNIQIIITKQDGTSYSLVAGVDYTVPAGITDLTNNTFQGNNGNDGSNLTINAIPEFITQIQIVYSNTGTGSLTGTQVVALGDLSFCTPLDTDGDGVFDFRDLDADNDGIPDNIEAQTTGGYIPPTGNYNVFGIDLAYGSGLTAVNTDEFATVGADTIPDYLDPDSDGDGTNDVLEALDTPLANDGTMVTGTVGTNGLIDDVETGDTDQGYTDINGEYVDPETDGLLSDIDNDVNIGGDLEYRDIVVGVDTDGDGIANTADIDDDGDGIPDTVELANFASTCNITYEFIGTIDGDRDRGAPDDLNKDFVFGDNYTFRVTFDSAMAVITETTIGDQSVARNGTVTVDGTVKNISTSAGSFQTVRHTSASATVHDILIVGPDMSVTTISIYDSNSNLIARFDFGTSTSTVVSGYIGVDSSLSQTMTTYTCYPTSADSDGDGVNNNLDIDADNDGIPDNVEAQTTSGYVAPTAVDTDGDGLADVYDPDCTGANCSGVTGVDLSTPNDHDGTGEPDYLDTDSDDDGTPDIQENGDSDNTLSGTDTDGDGLDDNFEGSNNDDGYDVNDEINTPSTDLPDEDSDLGAGGDVDFRDDTSDPVTPGVAGNTLWLRADLDVTGTTNVTLWEDQTSSLDFTGSGSPDATANLLNFNPTITFVSADLDHFTHTGNLNPRTMYIVYNDTSTASWITPFTNNDGDGIGHGHTDDTQIYNGTFTPAAVRDGSEYVSGLAADFLTIARPDNFEMHSRVFTSNISNASHIYSVGRDRTQARYLDGSIAEVMLFSDAHSDAERQRIESYLAVKYGFTLDPTDASGSIIEGDYFLGDGTTKVWDYTSNSAYHNNVAGIGRDDVMALNQKQSSSVESGTLITMGLTAIETSNALNSSTFVTNKDFLIWGNNDGSVLVGDVTSSTLICAPETTMARTWKVIENGAVGTVEVGVVQATIDAALVTANTIKVFKVADDASFTTNVEYIPLSTTQTINGVVNYVFDYDFNGTKYFTFSEINGIFWNGDSNAWSGGNSSGVTNGPSTNSQDRDKVMIIDAETSLTNAVLAESVEVECVWVKENSKLVIPTDAYLEFDEDFILDGEIRLVGDAQLVQTHTGLSNVQGTGKIYKDQQALVPNVYRYHYWSSPVRETGLDSYRVGQVLYDGNIPTSETSTLTPITWTTGYDGAPGTAGVTPITLSKYWIYTNLNDPGDGSAWVQQEDTGVIQRGQGFSMKSTGVVGQNLTFAGTPNDGSLVFNFTGAGETSLLGNPYPSALDITDFINANISSIDGTLYFWEHTGEDAASAGSEGHNQAGYQGGYSQRNISMGVAANGVAAIESETYDWENNTTQNAASVTQVVTEAASSTDVTVTYTVSSGVANLNTSYGDANGTTGNVLNNTAGLSVYTVDLSFDEKIDISSIYIVNDNPSAGDVLFTFNANNQGTSNNAERTITLNNDTGNTVSLNWNDIDSFIISGPSATSINLIIDDINWSLGGDISLGQGTYHAPSRYMAVGQGFFASSSATGGTVRFENSMRNYRSSSASSEATFFFRNGNNSRTAEEDEEDLLPIIKLGLGYYNENDYSLHRQIGISFRAANSFGFENGYDSEMFDVGGTDMYWEFDQIPDKKYVIAGVQGISEDLAVPLTIEINTDKTTVIRVDEQYNINVPFYLEDRVTGVFHDLSDGVQLDLPNGTYKDRFFLSFSNTALSTDENDILNKDVHLFVDQNTNEIVIKNFTNLNIEKVELYDILGQKIKTWKSLDSSPENRLKTTSLSAGVYIVNVISEKGKSSKKIVFD
ncbi:PA14 domain-containing protein [Flavobacteriaceae bacterium S356]|uniref:PA14 domain-containing protein n=1 Tax=Asprobacillus argus TaxID=3076534 RepID=A0ABU3LER3_9FLAO|nr:PA14 domain-containing protein [Flavobacteriaceae bacterium S356]